ncbi:hypothetical protein TWF281_001689 [Arthrobotrys megalospora]
MAMRREWATKQVGQDAANEESLEDVIFTNKFSHLGLGDEDEGETEEEIERPANSTQARKKASRGKKGKKGKGKKRGKTKASVKEPTLDGVPLESYRIIEDDTGIVTDYLMIVYAIVHQWIKLRHYLQKVWRDVAMLDEIRNWNPNIDLGQSTLEQRLKWRRAYTINWLYDLINVFCSVVVQRNTLKGQKWDLSRVDWSPNGPWYEHRTLYGLNGFAGEIASLVYQKSLDEIRPKISPHLVFQLACIVDSMTVSRGWKIGVHDQDSFNPPARKFRARRDVD